MVSWHRGDDERPPPGARRDGPQHVVKFAGAYHGHVDGCSPRRARASPPGMPASPGVTARRPPTRSSCPGTTGRRPPPLRRRQPRRRSSPSRCRRTWGGPAGAGFLELLRECRAEAGALLILDEVICGFRVARGGAQEASGSTPTSRHGGARGRPAGGGLRGTPRPDGAVAPAGDVYQAGTLSGTRSPCRRPRQLRELDPVATSGSPSSPIGWPPAFGRPPAIDRSGSSRCAASLCSLSAHLAGGRFRGRLFLRPGRLRSLLPRPARAPCLSAGVAVRGVVRVARPRRSTGRSQPPLRHSTISLRVSEAPLTQMVRSR